MWRSHRNRGLTTAEGVPPGARSDRRFGSRLGYGTQPSSMLAKAQATPRGSADAAAVSLRGRPKPIGGLVRFGSSAQTLRRTQPAGLFGSGTQRTARSYSESLISARPSDEAHSRDEPGRSRGRSGPFGVAESPYGVSVRRRRPRRPLRALGCEPRA